MSDLPAERISTEPLLKYVWLDIFGSVIERKEMKQYGIIFTRLSSRAVQLEVGQNI